MNQDAAPLPGELLMWVLIVSELLVFGAGLVAFMGVRLTDPAGFAEAQDHLYRTGAALNTVVLVTSGYLAARALHLREAARRGAARLHLVAALPEHMQRTWDTFQWNPAEAAEDPFEDLI